MLKESKPSCLLVHLSNEWGTVERTVLTDSIILSKAGYKVWVYCIKDSPLSLEVKNAKIEIMTHLGLWQPSGFTLFAPKGLGQIVKSESFKSIHLYQWDLLWPISHALRNKMGTSLFVSLFEEFKQSYSGVWYRPYVHRVDRYFLWGFIESDVIASDIGVHTRRMSHLGLPPAFNSDSLNPIIGRALEQEGSENIIIGLEVAPHVEDIEAIDLQLRAFAQLRLKSESKLVLYRRYPWRESVIWPDLEKRLHELGIFERSLVLDGPAQAELPKYVDLWLSTPYCEFSTFEYLLKGVPFCAPRTAFYSELIERTKAGESYRNGDMRELRQKIEQLCEKGPDFLPLGPAFYHQHGPDVYTKTLIGDYERAHGYRLCIARKNHSSLDT
ncbi:MAG: hypothetical protein Fur0010_10670 [Bdellovibrio sp.]